MLGGFSVGDSALKRVFVFHCVLPFTVLALVVLHVILVRARGQLSSVGTTQPLPSSVVSVYPSFVVKDVMALAFYLFALCVLCLLTPNLFVNSANYSPADYFSTPSDISPEWYFLPYFSILKAFESKAFGVFVVISIVLLMVILSVTHDKLSSRLLTAFYKPASVSVFVSFATMSFLGRRKSTVLAGFVSKVCVF